MGVSKSVGMEPRVYMVGRVHTFHVMKGALVCAVCNTIYLKNPTHIEWVGWYVLHDTPVYRKGHSHE